VQILIIICLLLSSSSADEHYFRVYATKAHHTVKNGACINLQHFLYKVSKYIFSYFYRTN